MVMDSTLVMKHRVAFALGMVNAASEAMVKAADENAAAAQRFAQAVCRLGFSEDETVLIDVFSEDEIKFIEETEKRFLSGDGDEKPSGFL